MINYFKIIQPTEYIITVIIQKDENFEEIKELTLNPNKNEDAYILAMIYHLDSNSIIEVDGKQYYVRECSIGKSYIFIYV